jgi:two-component sensor histidine kinase
VGFGVILLPWPSRFVPARGNQPDNARDMDQATAGDGLRPIALVAEVEPYMLDIERAVVVGIVVNEAITNALKHAFPGDAGGRVTVRFRRDAGRYCLTITDDGIGLPPEAEILPAGPRASGLGTRLLRALTAQFRGDFIGTRGPEGGTMAELCFPVRAVPSPERG